LASLGPSRTQDLWTKLMGKILKERKKWRERERKLFYYEEKAYHENVQAPNMVQWNGLKHGAKRLF
jgi:hypothetical protein